MIDALSRIDEQLFLKLNGQVSPFIDQLMFIISDKYVWIPFYIILLAFIIRKYRWKSIWIVIGAILLITLADQVSNVLKENVKRFRPCKDPEINHLVHIVNNYCRSSYGFVSGHAANSMALAGIISLMFSNKWIISGMVLWSAIVSYSRIYLGVHFPGDVMGGWVVGLFFAFLIYYILRRFGVLQSATRGN